MTLHVALAVIRIEINTMWKLCDIKSTIEIFKNKDLITNIRKSENPIKLKGIEGNTIMVDHEGDLLGYGSVYYNSQVSANILSFFNMAKKFKSLVYNNNKTDAVVVTWDGGTTFEFVPSKEGLYYYDFMNSIK
jgi:uncharacterized protein (DUF2164 family)